MQSPPHALFAILRESSERVRARWRPMVGYALVMTALEVVVMAPLVSFVLGRVVNRSGGMVGNTDIVGWVLSPAGLVFALLAGSCMNLEFVFRAAGQYWIAEAKTADRSIHTRHVVTRVLMDAPMLFRFSVVAFVVGVLLLLPLVAGIGLVYLLFLQTHDINYYLAVHPPEWYRALFVAGTWGVIWSLATALFLLRLIYALPALLSGERPLKRAFEMSWVRTRDEWHSVAATLGMSIVLWAAVHFALEGGLYLVMGFVVNRVGGSLTGLLLGISSYLVLTWILSTATSILGLAWVVTLVARLYRSAPFPSTAVDRLDSEPSTVEAGVPRRSWTRLLRPSVSVPALALILLISASISWVALNRRTALIKPIVIAHRAGASHAPENSLAALELAIEQGADAAEIDVQRTRDGVVVVNHDADLMRVARDPRIISLTDHIDLAGVDIGSGVSAQFAGEPMPTLTEFLERARNRIRLVIELKYYGGDPELIPAVVSLVRNADMADQVDLMSLELTAVHQARREAPEMPAGYLATVSVGDLARVEVDFLAVSQGQATGPLIRVARDQGVPVYAWTVNDPEGMLDLMDLGIDGIITDDSGLAVKTIRQVLTLSPSQRFILKFRDLWNVLDEAMLLIRDEHDTESATVRTGQRPDR